MSSHESAIIYGEDNRTEIFSADATQRATAVLSIAAMIRKDALVFRTGAERAELLAATLEDSENVCSDARFAMQVAAAECTAVLLDRDLLLTAGHCVQSPRRCEDYLFVFDYYYRAPDVLEAIHQADVYSCKRVVAQSTGERDFALIELSKSALDRRPVRVRSNAVEAGSAALVIGTPSGLPLKFITGATVLSNPEPDLSSFALDSDTAEGASGAGVFVAGELAGILSRGQSDFLLRADAGCQIERVVAETTASLHERVTAVAPAIEALCASGWNGDTLCGATRPSDAAVDAADASAPQSFEASPSEDADMEEFKAKSDGGCSVLRRSEMESSCSKWLLGITAALWVARRRAAAARTGRDLVTAERSS